MDDLHFIISSIWLGVHGQVGVHGTLSGLDFPVRGISLRRSVHDTGFVCGRDRWGTLCFFGIVCGHFFCKAAESADVHSLAVISG